MKKNVTIKFKRFEPNDNKNTYKVNVDINLEIFSEVCKDLAYNFNTHKLTVYKFFPKKDFTTTWKNRGNTINYDCTGFTVIGLDPYKVLLTYFETENYVNGGNYFHYNELFELWIQQNENQTRSILNTYCNIN